MELGLIQVYPGGPPTAVPDRADEVKVPSFTQADVHYTFNRNTQRCTCPRGRYVKLPCKHKRLALSDCPDHLIEEAEKGKLADGRQVLELYHHYRLYRRPAMGYDAGEWLHAISFDGTDFILESSHTSGLHDPKIRTIDSWYSWEQHTPPERFEYFHVPEFIFPTQRS